jgi:hypothetical protein
MTLCGVFDQISAKEFPATAQFAVYAKLRGGSGTHELVLEMVDAKHRAMGDQPPTFMVECKTNSAVEFVTFIGGLKLESPGWYQVRIRSGPNVLGRPYPIMVCAVEQKP